ncbi:MAG TPA: fatty acid desaturase [Caulobacteraceae bacterium]|jgi:fatty acid desaturase
MDDWIARNGHKVVPRDRLRELSVRSDLKGWGQTISHVGAIGVTTTAIILVPPSLQAVLAPLLLIQGVLINCLYAGLHELSHWTVFKTKVLNDWVGGLFGLVTLNPFHTDRWSHFAHHRATHDPLLDSELMGMKPYTTASYALEFIGVSFWRRRITTVVRTAQGRGLERDYWLTPEQLRMVVWEARAHVGFWTLVAALSALFHSWIAVLCWLGPLLATKAFHQLQNTGEHTGLAHDSNTFRNTRTLRGPPVMRWLVWNMSYHTAHHCFPGVPFHALPQLHRDIVAGLDHPVATLGYIEAQREIYASLSRSSRLARAAS